MVLNFRYLEAGLIDFFQEQFPGTSLTSEQIEFVEAFLDNDTSRKYEIYHRHSLDLEVVPPQYPEPYRYMRIIQTLFLFACHRSDLDFLNTIYHGFSIICSSRSEKYENPFVVACGKNLNIVQFFLDNPFELTRREIVLGMKTAIETNQPKIFDRLWSFDWYHDLEGKRMLLPTSARSENVYFLQKLLDWVICVKNPTSYPQGLERNCNPATIEKTALAAVRNRNIPALKMLYQKFGQSVLSEIDLCEICKEETDSTVEFFLQWRSLAGFKNPKLALSYCTEQANKCPQKSGWKRKIEILNQHLVC